METFSCKTKIISGKGALEALSGLSIRRFFLVSDPYFVRTGAASRAAALTKAQDICVFDRVEPDPTVTLAAEGTVKLRAFCPDAIGALGGGSAMDLAKTMAYFAGGDARLIAIPTTSGSGSEVTNFSILTHQGVKHPLVDEKLRPDYAILDSDLLRELPPALIADTGFDVLTHAAEAVAAGGAGPVTDALAREAFAVCFRELPASFGGDSSRRLDIHLAATMAGMAFSGAGLGLCHAMAHSLGGLFHVPHGRLNAILLPSVMACNAPVAGKAYAALARAAGLGGSSDTMAVRELKTALLGLRRRLRLPGTLAEAGIAPQALWRSSGEIVRAALEDPCCASNPVPPEASMIQRILEEVTGRG